MDTIQELPLCTVGHFTIVQLDMLVVPLVKIVIELMIAGYGFITLPYKI